MPLFIGALIGAIISALGTLVGRVLVSLGIGYAVFSGVDASIAWARDFLISHISAIGGNFVAVVSTMKIGVCVSMISSAYVMRLTIAGLSSGVLKKMVVK